MVLILILPAGGCSGDKHEPGVIAAVVPGSWNMSATELKSLFAGKELELEEISGDTFSVMTRNNPGFTSYTYQYADGRLGLVMATYGAALGPGADYAAELQKVEARAASAMRGPSVWVEQPAHRIPADETIKKYISDGEKSLYLVSLLDESGYLSVSIMYFSPYVHDMAGILERMQKAGYVKR